MKLVIGVVVGFLIGYQLGRIAATREGGDAMGAGWAGSATRLGQGAIQRARTTIQSRLAGDGETSG